MGSLVRQEIVAEKAERETAWTSEIASGGAGVASVEPGGGVDVGSPSGVHRPGSPESEAAAGSDRLKGTSAAAKLLAGERTDSNEAWDEEVWSG
jgi:hypothetical protein